MKYKLKIMTTSTLILALSSIIAVTKNVQAEPVIQNAIENDINEKLLNTDKEINRAEFFVLVNNTLGFVDEVDIYFSDVVPESWYAPHIRRAVAAGYIQGFEDGTVRPTNNITRAEVSVVLNNILKLPIGSAVYFTDELPSWAYESINAVTKAGIIQGFEDGSFRATDSITIAEAAEILLLARDFHYDREEPIIIGEPKREDVVAEKEEILVEGNLEIRGDFGTEKLQVVNGNVKIVGSVPAEIQNLKINGDLRIGVSVEDNLVFLNNVTVTGTVYIYAINVHLLGEFNNVYINQENTRLRLKNSGGTSIENFNVASSAKNSRISLDRNTRIENANIDAVVAINGTGRIGVANISVLGVTVTNNAIIEGFILSSQPVSRPNAVDDSNNDYSENNIEEIPASEDPLPEEEIPVSEDPLLEEEIAESEDPLLEEEIPESEDPLPEEKLTQSLDSVHITLKEPDDKADDYILGDVSEIIDALNSIQISSSVYDASNDVNWYVPKETENSRRLEIRETVSGKVKGYLIAKINTDSAEVEELVIDFRQGINKLSVESLYTLIIPAEYVTVFEKKVQNNIVVPLVVTHELIQELDQDDHPLSYRLERVKVIRAIDGDTIELEDGRRVRLIGVDSPERDEEGFEEATDFTRDAVEGRVVYLEKDGNETDVFGRLRRYVWIIKPSDVYDVNQVNRYMLNAKLLINNHAVVAILGTVRLEEHFRGLYELAT